MTSELITADMRKIVTRTLTNGIVVKHDGCTMLARAYTWRAAFTHLVEDHIVPENAERWCTLKCFAQFLHGRASPSNMLDARDRIVPLAGELRRKGELLVIDYGGPGGAKSAMRLFVADDDPAVVESQIVKMEQMGDMAVERAAIARRIVRLKQQFKNSRGN